MMSDHFVEIQGECSVYIYIYACVCVCDMLHLRKLTCHIQKGPIPGADPLPTIIFQRLCSFCETVFFTYPDTNLMMGKGQFIFPT